MAFSVSTTYSIVFAGLVVSAMMAYPAATGAVEQVTDAGDEDLERQRTLLEADAEFTVADWDGSQATLKAENTGETTLSVESTDLLVDGEYRSLSDVEGYTVENETGTDLWAPGETLRVDISVATPPRVKLVTEGGVAMATESTRTATPRVVFADADRASTLRQNSTFVDSYNTSDTQVVGPIAPEFGNDTADEVPFADSNGTVAIVDSGGERHDLTSGSRSSFSRLAIGTWSGSERSIFYVSSATDAIRRVTADGSDTLVVSLTAAGVAGIADFDGDGADEIVYGGTSPDGLANSVNFVDDTGTIVATTVTYDTGDGIGLGEPGDFDGDGEARVPIVNSLGDIVLVGDLGGTEALTSTGPAKPSPLATVDWDDDGSLEVVFVASDGTLSYVDDVGGSNTVRTVTDLDGNAVAADADAGAA